MAEKISKRNSEFLQQSSPEVLKIQRESGIVQLRKRKRQEHASKKRGFLGASTEISKELVFPVEIISEGLRTMHPSLCSIDLTAGARVKALLKIITNAMSNEELVLALSCLKSISGKNENMPYDQLFDHELIQIFLSLLGSHDTNIKILILWCLINIFNNASKVIEEFVNKGIFYQLVYIIKNEESSGVLENCIWVIGNLIGEGKKYRCLVIEKGVCEDLIKFSKSSNVQLQRISVWALSNLCKDFEVVPASLVDQIFEIVHVTLKSTDLEILSDSLWILDYFTKESANYIQTVVNLNVIPFLITSMHHFSSKIQSPSLKILSNIIYHSEPHQETLLSMGFLQHLFSLLSSRSDTIKRESLFIFSNLFLSNIDIVLQIVNDDNIKKIVEFLNSDKFDLQKNAVYCICGALAKKHMIINKRLLDFEIVQTLIKCLGKCEESNVLKAVLKSIRFLFEILSDVMNVDQWENFLKEFQKLEGIDKLENLQYHRNQEVFAEAKAIIEEFIGTEEKILLQPTHGFSFS